MMLTVNLTRLRSAHHRLLRTQDNTFLPLEADPPRSFSRRTSPHPIPGTISGGGRLNAEPACWSGCCRMIRGGRNRAIDQRQP